MQMWIPSPEIDLYYFSAETKLYYTGEKQQNIYVVLSSIPSPIWGSTVSPRGWGEGDVPGRRREVSPAHQMSQVWALYHFHLPERNDEKKKQMGTLSLASRTRVTNFYFHLTCIVLFVLALVQRIQRPSRPSTYALAGLVLVHTPKKA